MLSEEFVLEEFLSVLINEGWNWAKNCIKKAYQNKSSKNESYEARMYTAFVNSFCKYSGINPESSNETTLEYFFYITEKYAQQVKQRKNDLRIPLIQILNELDSKYTPSNLITYTSLEKLELFREIILEYIANHDDLKNRYIIHISTEANESIRKVTDISQEIKSGVDSINKRFDTIEAKVTNSSLTENNNEKLYPNNTKFFNDEKEEYIKKWNSRLFLHKKVKDKPLTLKNTYIPPLSKIIYPKSLMDSEPKDNLSLRLDNFFEHGKSLLLIGAPGIGKTSIVSYLANKYKDNLNVIIMRFSKWDTEEWDSIKLGLGESLLAKAIMNKISCNAEFLQDKVLILDGFDEIKYIGDQNDLLNKFIIWSKPIRNLKILVTSRENYIQLNHVKFEKAIKLCPFDERKISNYSYNILGKYIAEDHKLLNIDKEVYGIPVILYMALTVGIDILCETNRCNAYEKIFSLDGGIFDRFSFNNLEGYEYFAHILSFDKLVFFDILCKTAYEMFSNYKQYLSLEKYNSIINGTIRINRTLLSADSLAWMDFPIDNLYEKGNQIQFIHNSIYEYFASEYIFRKIESIFNEMPSEIIEKGCKIIAEIFCSCELSIELQEFLHNKIKNSTLNNTITKDYIIDIMYNILKNGPSYYLNKKRLKLILEKNLKYKNIILLENTLFKNMLQLIQYWDPDIPYTYTNQILFDLIINYIHCDLSGTGFNLSYMHICGNRSFVIGLYENRKSEFRWMISRLNCKYFILSGKTINIFCGLNLVKVSFSNSFLETLDFEFSNLSNSNFNNCGLYEVLIRRCYIHQTVFSGSILNTTTLLNSDVEEVKFEATIIKDSTFNYSHFLDTTFVGIMCLNRNKFNNSSFENTILNGNFNCSDFEFTDFRHASLIGSFKKANFRNAIFRDETYLNGTFTDADFRGADLSGAIYTHELDDAIL